MTRFLLNLPLAIKVALAPVFAIACLLLTAIVARSANVAGTTSLKAFSDEHLPRAAAVAELRTRIIRLDAMVMRSLAYEGSGMKAARIEAVDKAIAEEIRAVSTRVGEQQRGADPAEQAQWDTLAKSVASFGKQALDTLDMKADGGLSQAAMLMTSTEQEHARMAKTMDELVAQVNDRSRAAAGDAIAAADRADLTSLTTLAGAVAIAAFFTVLCVRLIVRPLRAAVQVAQEVADGNLALAPIQAARDETGQVLEAMQGVAERLRELMGRIQSAAHQIEGAASEIAYGNQNLSTRTEVTASELQETASTMESLTRQMHDASEGASRAHQLATQAAGIARQGGAAVHEAVASMEQIAGQAHRIGDIVGVIDSLSFQTNILALNAAVEAARAGEHGRGFAVVAEEVRALAGRSTTASKEIRALIGESVEQAGVGARKAQAAGEIMEQVVAAIEDASALITSIAKTSQDQAGDVATVSSAVHKMDGSTQQNAALVEQAAAATVSLQEQARALKQSLAVFRTA